MPSQNCRCSPTCRSAPTSRSAPTRPARCGQFFRHRRSASATHTCAVWGVYIPSYEFHGVAWDRRFCHATADSSTADSQSPIPKTMTRLCRAIPFLPELQMDNINKPPPKCACVPSGRCHSDTLIGCPHNHYFNENSVWTCDLTNNAVRPCPQPFLSPTATHSLLDQFGGFWRISCARSASHPTHPPH
jgi:hypothetical protein